MDLAPSPGVGASSSLLIPNERKTVGFTVGVGDLGKNFVCSSAITIALDAAATLGNGFYFFVTNESGGAITLDANGSEQFSYGVGGAIAGTYKLNKAEETVLIICNGSLGASWHFTVFAGNHTFAWQDLLPQTTNFDADTIMVGSVANSDIRQISISNLLNQNCFIANRNNVDQANVATATPTKVAHNSSFYDPLLEYDATTNYRYTPLKAGFYLVVGSLEMKAMTSTSNYVNSYIYKNGAVISRGRDWGANGSSSDVTPVTTALVAMNGSTDYLEHFAYQNDGGNRDIEGDIDSTYFFACRIST